MSKAEQRDDKIDPDWPEDPREGGHPVSELAADRQGSLSPYGDVTFPLDPATLGYVHPQTEINWKPLD